MKWLTKQKQPKEGGRRERLVFAWLPTEVGDYTVWLESYRVFEIYSTVPDDGSIILLTFL